MAIVGEDAWNERVKLFWNGEVVVRKVEVVRADRSDIFWRGVSEGSSSGRPHHQHDLSPFRSSYGQVSASFGRQGAGLAEVDAATRV